MPKIFKLSIVLLAVITAAVYASTILQIKNIDLNSQDCIKQENLDFIGKFIFSINEETVQKDLSQKYPCVTQVKIDKIFPHTLKVDIYEQKPAAQIADTDFQITSAGQIVSGNDSSLPKLYLQNETKVQKGNKIDDENVLFAALTAALVTKTDFHIATIRIVADTQIAFYAQDQTVALFSPKKTPSEQVDSLQQTLAAAKIEGAKLQKIDLRFDKPVVTFK